MTGRVHVYSELNEKSLKRYRANGGDRLSNLPDVLISDILSHLPIKDALQTCVLSQSWEFKWMSVYNVTMDVRLFPKLWRDEVTLLKFVDRILLHLQNLKTFHLNLSRTSPSFEGGDFTTCCKGYEFSRVMTWISAVLSRNIESLELRMRCGIFSGCNHKDPILPRSLVKCASLRRLVVDMYCIFKVSVSNCFPNLTSLYLERVRILYENTESDVVKFSFPVLKEFELVKCKWLKVRSVEINAPSLIAFKSETPYEMDDYQEHTNYSIEIIGASLTQLKIDGSFPEHIILKGSTVVNADVKCFFEHSFVSHKEGESKVRKLLGELSSVENLRLHEYLPLARTLGPPHLEVALSLPMFVKLEKLYLHRPFCYDDRLVELFHATPFLRFLEIYVHNYNYDDFVEVELVPSCIANHLEEVAFDYSKAPNEPQYHLEKFLLKNGVHLKKVCVSHRADNKKHIRRSDLAKKRIVEQLSSFPKASISCLIIACP